MPFQIAVLQKKGGTGKSTISYNLARYLKFFYISNDDSVIPVFYKKGKYQNPAKYYNENIIYDFGGYVDKSALVVLERVNIIIIPVTNDLNCLKRTKSLLKELTPSLRKKVIVVANMIRDDKDIIRIREIVDIDFMLGYSKLYENALSNKTSVDELATRNKFNEYRYRNAYEQWMTFATYIKERIINEK